MYKLSRFSYIPHTCKIAVHIYPQHNVHVKYLEKSCQLVSKYGNIGSNNNNIVNEILKKKLKNERNYYWLLFLLCMLCRFLHDTMVVYIPRHFATNACAQHDIITDLQIRKMSIACLYYQRASKQIMNCPKGNRQHEQRKVFAHTYIYPRLNMSPDC